MRHYSGEEMDKVSLPSLLPGQKEIVLITHDESIFRANDDCRFVRVMSDEQLLRPKS